LRGGQLLGGDPGRGGGFGFFLLLDQLGDLSLLLGQRAGLLLLGLLVLGNRLLLGVHLGLRLRLLSLQLCLLGRQ